jgi:hypothetical protein
VTASNIACQPRDKLIVCPVEKNISNMSFKFFHIASASFPSNVRHWVINYVFKVSI